MREFMLQLQQSYIKSVTPFRHCYWPRIEFVDNTFESDDGEQTGAEPGEPRQRQDEEDDETPPSTTIRQCRPNVRPTALDDDVRHICSPAHEFHERAATAEESANQNTPFGRKRLNQILELWIEKLIEND